MKKPTRTSYYATAVVLIIGGFSLGVVSYYSDTEQFTNLITVGAHQQTIVNLETTTTDFAILIFVSGAIFSTGLSMLFAFPEFDDQGRIKGG